MGKWKAAMGNGQELRDDISELFRPNKDTKAFDEKWGNHMSEVIIFNFVLPVYQAVDRQAKAREIAPKLDLFCAAFV